MITLITATPGGGKTSLAVAMALKEGAGRKIYCDAIPDLSIDYEPLPPLEQWTELRDDASSITGKKVCFNFPPNSIIILDEAQRIYRPRASSSKVPDYVAAFETHRHEGLDFWLITQKTGLIDSHVRGLVGRHLHIRKGWFGRYLFEWPECGDTESRASRSLAASSRYKLPSHVFDLYKSATVHVKEKHRIPAYALLFVVATLVFFGMAAYLYNKITSVSSPVKSPALLVNGKARHELAGVGQKVAALGDWNAERAARNVDLPHTAPVFDGLRVPSDAPFPVACVQIGHRCACYTSQATLVAMRSEMCVRIVKEGIFDEARKSDALQVAAVSRPDVVVGRPPVPVSAPEVGAAVVSAPSVVERVQFVRGAPLAVGKGAP